MSDSFDDDFFSIDQTPICKCSANKGAIYTYTADDLYTNNIEPDLDILILLEHKEVPAKLQPFLKLCNTYFRKYKYQVVNALGCTPSGFTSADTISTYQQCKEIHIKKKIDFYNPKVIITTGRSLYTITESKELKPDHFFVPVNDALKDYDLDDTFIYSSEFNCKVFPIPALYQWIGDNIKDVYEYKFVVDQFKRAIDSIENPIRRPVKKQFINVKNPNEFITSLINNKEIKAISVDLETSGFNYFEDTLYSIQLATDTTTGYFIKFSELDKDLLIKLFEREDIFFLLQNAQFDLRFLKVNGIHNAHCNFEVMLASHLLNENSPNGLKPNTWLYTLNGGYEKKLKTYMKEHKVTDFTKLPENLLIEYACYDAIITYELYLYFSDRLLKEDKDLYDNYYNCIIPSVEMIVDVEMTGVQIDFTYLASYIESLKKKMKEIENELYIVAKKPFNIRSTKELSVILRTLPNFTVLTDDKGNELTSKNGSLKLDKETIDRYVKELDLPFMKLISEYNHLSKEISQFGFEKKGQSTADADEGLFEEVNLNEDNDSTTGFLASIYKGNLHGGYKLYGTETGRMSGGGGLNSSINWQNMPGTKEFRKIFLPRDGYVFARADYDMMEVSILSQIAGPGVLEELILDGKDMHCYTGVALYKLLTGKETTYEEILSKTKVEGQEDEYFCKIRKLSKNLNFQCSYGATKHGIADLFGVSSEEGEKFLNAYYESYPEVEIYIQQYRSFAKKTGYVKTLLGRKRRVPQLTYIGTDSFRNKSSFNINNLLNSAINSPVQGSSGQTTLLAMVNIRKEFKEKQMKSHIIINVHDEIVFELLIEEIPQAAEIIKKWMEYPYYTTKDNNRVRLTAGLEYGEIWKYSYSQKYWNNNPEELQLCLDNIKQRNKDNKF